MAKSKFVHCDRQKVGNGAELHRGEKKLVADSHSSGNVHQQQMSLGKTVLIITNMVISNVHYQSKVWTRLPIHLNEKVFPNF